MNTKPVLEVLNLSKRYTDFQLQINNLKIQEGSIVGLIGENGSGKSTFLNLLLNQIKSDSCNMKILGLDSDKDEYQIKLNLGVILEQNYFPNSFSIQQIEKMLKMIYPSWDKELYYSLIDKFALPINKAIGDFSRGMVVKLNFAATLSHHPKLLIADEATSGLDPIVRKEILTILKKYVDNNRKLSVWKLYMQYFLSKENSLKNLSKTIEEFFDYCHEEYFQFVVDDYGNSYGLVAYQLLDDCVETTLTEYEMEHFNNWNEISLLKERIAENDEEWVLKKELVIATYNFVDTLASYQRKIEDITLKSEWRFSFEQE